jgi:hypothetical protein
MLYMLLRLQSIMSMFTVHNDDNYTSKHDIFVTTIVYIVTVVSNVIGLYTSES